MRGKRLIQEKGIKCIKIKGGYTDVKSKVC